MGDSWIPGPLPPPRSRTGGSPGSGTGTRPDVRTAADPPPPRPPRSPLTTGPEETPRDDTRRRWIAERLTVADLADGPPPLAPDERVSVAELEAAGFAPGPGQRIAAVLGDGTLPVRDSGLTPLEQTALRMMRPGPWTEQLEAVAARASRRIRESAFHDFAPGRSATEAASEDVAPAGDSARTLVLPPAHPERADARYAEAPFRDAVGQRTDRLLDTGAETGTHTDSAAPLADGIRAVPEPAPRSPAGPATASEQEPAAVPPTAAPPVPGPSVPEPPVPVPTVAAATEGDAPPETADGSTGDGSTGNGRPDKGKGRLGEPDAGPVADPTAPDRPGQDDAGTSADLTAARAELAAATARTAALEERLASGVGGSTDSRAGLDAARARTERAQQAWAAALERWREPDATAVPALSYGSAERRWISAQVTGEDVPADVADLTDLTEPADLAAPHGGTAEQPSLALPPVERVRTLMARPGPWPGVLDTVAANMARRKWRQAHAEYAQAAPDLGEEALGEAWRTAQALVLPLELHAVEADARYAGDHYRAAVREVADLLAAGGGRTAARALADRLRHRLGLPVRVRGGAAAGPAGSPAAARVLPTVQASAAEFTADTVAALSTVGGPPTPPGPRPSAPRSTEPRPQGVSEVSAAGIPSPPPPHPPSSNGSPATGGPPPSDTPVAQERTAPRRSVKARPAGARIDRELGERRPPRLDPELLPPPRITGPSAFSDGSRMPGYLDGSLPFPADDPAETDGTGADRSEAELFAFGQSEVRLRGAEQVTAGIRSRLAALDAESRPARLPPPSGEADRAEGIETDVLRRLARALTEQPRTFAGDGREFLYRAESGRLRKLHVGVRNHGAWERFGDGAGPTKVDTAYRGQTTVGDGKSFQQNRQLSPSIPLGPLKKVVSVFGRLTVRLGWSREIAYALHDQTLSQSETRTLDGSHLHLDDVSYELRITDALPPRLARRGVLGTRWRSRPARAAAGEVAFGIGVRNGLAARLPDSVTNGGAAVGRTPRRMELGPESDYRMFVTEDFGPTTEIRAWAVGEIGAEPGSGAYDELADFFSSANLHRLSSRTAHSMVPGPPLFGDDKERTPLGAFVIERVVPGRAVLASETDQAELRDTAQLTLHNTRKETKEYKKDLGAAVGLTVNAPTFGLQDVIAGWMNRVRPRIRFGPGLRLVHSEGRIAVLGATGGLKSTGRVKSDDTALYRVEKTVHVRRTGDARPRAFRTWSLDRMTRSEARRLAGLDEGDGPAGRHGGEPYAPAYLTEDRPPTLGMSRVVQFRFPDGHHTGRRADAAGAQGTGHTDGDRPGPPPASTLLTAFTQQVLREVAAAYPGTVAPLDQLDPAAARWRSHRHYAAVLHNTFGVLNALSRHSSTGSLEAMAGKGVPLVLTEPGRFLRGHHHIRLHAELTGRRYEGAAHEILRHSAPGSVALDAGRQLTRGTETTVEGALSLRDADLTDAMGAPMHAGTVHTGYRAVSQRRIESGYGAVATADPMAASVTPGHLFSYNVALTVRTSGYRRFRRFWRGLPSLGLLGTRLFVLRDRPADLIGGDSGVPAVTGRVLLSVPAEHTPDRDPHAPGADNPYRRPDRVTGGRLPRSRARALTRATLSGADTGREPDALDGVPHHTLSVLTGAGEADLAQQVLEEAAHGAWQLTQDAAPAHDAAVRTLQPSYLTANFDQSISRAGLRTTGLFGEGPYLNRLARTVHRARVTGLRALGGPVRMDTELTAGGSTRASGTQGASRTQQAGVTLVYGETRPASTGVTSNYAWRLWPFHRSRGRSAVVTRTATADTNRIDRGHQVLAAGDVRHEFATEVRGLGPLSPLGKVVPALRDWAGRWQRSEGGWLGHLPERVAAQLGLVRGDGLGAGPVGGRRGWAQPDWFRRHPFAAYPVDPLDTAAAVEAFVDRLRDLAVDEESREAVRRIASARVTRALRREMAGTGSATTARTGGPGWKRARIGGRNVRIRAQLVPVEGGQTFDRLWPATEMEHHLWAVETLTDLSTSESGFEVGLMTNEAVHTGDSAAKAAGPSAAGSAGGRRNRTSASTTTVARRWKTNTLEPHAEFTTRFRIRLTLELGRARGDEPRDPDSRRRVHEEEAGAVKDLVPLSLLRPDPGGRGRADDPRDPLRPPEVPDEPPAVHVYSGDANPAARAGGIEEWRTLRQPDGARRPFEMPAEGFQVRAVLGTGNIQAASTLALAKAYDNRLAHLTGRLAGEPLAAALRTARLTPLTAEGTGPAQVLEDSHRPGALSAFAERAAAPAGLPTAGLAENTLLDASQAALTQHTRLDLAGARLLAVTDGARMESHTRYTRSGNAAAGENGGHSLEAGGFPTLTSDPVGKNNPGGISTGADAVETDVQAAGHDQAHQVNVKPKTGRMFTFAVPTAWLSVAEVERQFKDGSLATWVRDNLMGPFGGVAPGPQAVETQAWTVAWVEERVARELGLVTDGTFPRSVTRAWDRVHTQAKAWEAADGAYWALRRELPDLRDAVQAALAGRSVARRRRDAAGHVLKAAGLGARKRFEAAVAAADGVLELPVAELSPGSRSRLAPALAAAAQASEDVREAVLGRLLVPPEAGAERHRAAEERLAAARELQGKADAEAARLRRAERDHLVQEAAWARDRRLTEAVAELGTAERAVSAAADTLRRAERVLAVRLRRIEEQHAAAESAADALFEIRGAADRLTRWHQLPADPVADGAAPTRGGMPEPVLPPVRRPDRERAAGAPRGLPTVPEAPQAETGPPDRYTALTSPADDSTGAPGLRAPDGTAHWLRDVPGDNSFCRAFDTALEVLAGQADSPVAPRGGPPRTAVPAGPAVGDPAALRIRFADALASLPDDSPLLGYLAPDERDTFTSPELDAAALDLGNGTPQQREFEALGVIPHSAGDRPGPEHAHRPLSPAQRRGLAAAQLRRPPDAEGGTGWDHGAADILPALAAELFGLRVRIVLADGSFLDHWPRRPEPASADPPTVVLHLAGRHYRAVLPQDAVDRPPPSAPPATAPPTKPAGVLPSHRRRPWTREDAAGTDPADPPGFDAASDPATLTDSDGRVLDLHEPRGPGNGFHEAVARALVAAGGAAGDVGRLALRLRHSSLTAPHPLPSTARLDPRAAFTREWLELAGITLTPQQERDFERHGGRLPADLAPGAAEDRLIRLHLFQAVRWDTDTALLAAGLLARTWRVHLTLVHENGTCTVFGDPATPPERTVTVYERGRDFLAAVPRGAHDPTAPGSSRVTAS
ncbi:hypothetical protein AB0939_07755 [Streptomyces sp. NPDC006990]|uniref:hypothetical protein n=1 Tax=Streptomyces sp. NPDC006990 TaxID=3154481 RepID=UPI0034547541